MPSASINNKTPREGRFSWLRLLVALGLFAYLMAWLTPDHYPPWLTFHGESLTFAALIALSVAMAIHEKDVVFDRPVLVPLALIGVVWLQWALGFIAYTGEAAVSSLYLGGFALAWLLGSALANKPGVGLKSQEALAGLLVAAAAISVYAAAVQWLDLEADYANLVVNRLQSDRPQGNLAQPNHLAVLILMAVVMTAWLHHQKRLKSWQLWALLVWLSFGLTMAGSRAGWLSAVILGLFALWQCRADVKVASARAVFGWWFMLLGMWAAWKPVNDTLLLVMHARSLPSMAQDPSRLMLWRQMVAGIEQSPWWGYGWGQTVAGHQAGSAQISSGMLTDYAHSVVLDLTLWLGVPLAVLLMAILAWWLLRAVRNIRNPRQQALMAAALPVMVHSMVEFSFAYAYFLFTVAWLLGTLSGLQTSAERRVVATRPWRPRFALVTAIVIFTGSSLWAVFDYLRAEEDFRVLRFEMRGVGRTPDGYEAPRLLLLNQLGAVLRLGRLHPSPDTTREELEDMRALLRNYNWATLKMRYAVALALTGRGEQATAELLTLRTHYGEKSYSHAKQFIKELQNEQYPQLKDLRIP